jgi:hypothetical protein
VVLFGEFKNNLWLVGAFESDCDLLGSTFYSVFGETAHGRVDLSVEFRLQGYWRNISELAYYWVGE